MTRPRRGYVEVKVCDGETEQDELIGDWEMPNQLRHELDLAARTAVAQSKHESKRSKATE